MTTDQWQEMDEYCIKIIQFFLTTMQRYRFNELYRAISEAGARMSRPTLSEHLKHLVKQELVERKVEGVQTVTYTLNYGKFFNLKEIMELPDNMLEKQKEFNASPIDEQIRQVLLARGRIFWKEEPL